MIRRTRRIAWFPQQAAPRMRQSSHFEGNPKAPRIKVHQNHWTHQTHRVRVCRNAGFAECSFGPMHGSAVAALSHRLAMKTDRTRLGDSQHFCDNAATIVVIARFHIHSYFVCMAKSTGKSLVIVESPAKARTISKFLGSDYQVEASIGHVRDLPAGKKDVPEKYKSRALGLPGRQHRPRFRAAVHRAGGQKEAGQEAQRRSQGGRPSLSGDGRRPRG